jgi:hypothetical protein
MGDDTGSEFRVQASACLRVDAPVDSSKLKLEL